MGQLQTQLTHLNGLDKEQLEKKLILKTVIKSFRNHPSFDSSARRPLKSYVISPFKE